MHDRDDPRPPVAATLSPLAAEPRQGLEMAARLGVRGVQVSAGQPGTRPRDLDRSGRRDLLVATRRRELAIVGVDAWIRAEDLLDRTTVDAAVDRLLDAIDLAGDLGPVPVATRFPNEGGEEAIRAVLASAERVGVQVVDHAVPPRGRAVKSESASPSAGGGLIVPGSLEIVETVEPAPGEAFDGLGFGIDPPAWLVAGLDLLDAAGRRIDALRLADLTRDGMRIPPGDADGRVDPASLLAIARTGGFEGVPIIDARRWTNPVEGIRATVERLA